MAAAVADGTREAELTVSRDSGAHTVVPAAARQTFTVLEGETTLTMRLVIDRVPALANISVKTAEVSATRVS